MTAPEMMTGDYQQSVVVEEIDAGRDVVYRARVSIEYVPVGREGDAVKARGALMRFEAAVRGGDLFEALGEATSLALHGARVYHEGVWEHDLQRS